MPSRSEFSEDLAKALGMDMRTLRQSLAGVVEYKGKDWGQGDVIGVVRFVQARCWRGGAAL